MGSLRNPVGPLPSTIYWRRRAVLLSVLGLLALLTVWVVGTGGGGVYHVKRVAPHSEVRENASYGVLKLVLLPGRYEWAFVAVEGQSFTDTGTSPCSPARVAR